jgi:hypothetical protein
MSAVRLLWKSSGGRISLRPLLVCAAIGFLLARGVPPSLRQLIPGLVASSLAGNDHKQCFDHDDFQWLSSPSAAPTALQPFASSAPAVVPEPHLEVATDGWHYNRPPPVS